MMGELEGDGIQECMQTFGVFYYTGHLAFHDGDGRVCGAQIDTNDGTLDFLIGVVSYI
jgi:hypothetical protein